MRECAKKQCSMWGCGGKKKILALRTIDFLSQIPVSLRVTL
jgi:hypothetical protein